MSRTIDEKIVSMQFDNAQFERNVRTSMGTLDRLKQSLNLTGAAKGLENVNAAAKGLDMSPLANGLETVKAKFSALEVMAVTSLANITNSAVNAGKRLVSAFTIDPIKTGFQEYETQINAVQTILSNTRSKGTTLDQVNEALDELNHYADMTIYNFTEMTRNIGTFTAAGVDLDTSVSAIKGIANLAAVSGSTSQQASTAMYQLSQALAAGTVKLQDWNSVVNAGMGGQVFQDALKETARVHGIAIDDMIKKEGSFRETLSKGWLSSQILTETLAKFTGDLTEEQLKSMGYTDEQAKSIVALGEDANNAATKVKTFTQLLDTLKEAAQSGWTQTWEYIIGDFEDAKKLWTSVSDTLSEMINQSAEARNKVVGEWAENGGRAAAIESIKNAFDGLMNIISSVKAAFREVFPPTTSDQLIRATEKVRDLTAAFKDWTEKYGPQIKSTFKGLFAVLELFASAVKKVVGGAVKLVSNITGLAGAIIKVTGTMGGWLSALGESIKETDVFGRTVDGLVGFLQKAIDKAKSFFKAIGEKVDSSSLEDFTKAPKNIWNLIGKLGQKIGSAFSDLFRSGDIQNALGILNGGLLTSIFLGLKKAFSGGGPNKVAEFLQNLLNPLENIEETPAIALLDELKGCLEAYQQDLKAKTLIKIAAAIGILAAALFVISAIDPADLASALTGMAVLFAELVGAMAALNKFAGGYKNSAKSVAIMTGMSVSILILAGALKTLSGLKWGELAVGLTGVLGLMTILVGAMKVMSTNEKQFIKGASQMVIMAAALKILASVCKDLSQLSWGQLAKGVSGIGGILLTFVGYQTLMSLIKPTKMVQAALSLAIIGGAMEIFADVCGKLGSLDWGQLAKAGAGMTGILAIAAGFGILSGLAKKMAGSAIALAILGGAMEIFADVCQKFSIMEWGELAKAGAAIAGVLAFAAGFALLSGLAKEMRGSVISLTIMAAAMEIFADVCQKFAGMEWEGLAKAGSAIAGILLLCSGFALLASLSGGILKAAGALAIMSVALAVIAPVLKLLGGMSWGAIAKGLVAIAGAFAVMWGAAIMLTPVIPSILALAGAIALLGVAALAFGAGVTLLGTGITSLAIALAAGVTAIVDGVLTILEGLGKALILIGKAIIEAAPILGAAITAVILALVDSLAASVPGIVAGLMTIIVGVLEALVKYTPVIVNYIFDFLIGAINALGERIPDLVVAVVNFFGKVFSGIIEALGKVDTKVLIDALLGVGLLAAFIVALNALAGLIPGAMAGLLGVGALVVELGLVLAAIGALAQIPGLEWLIGEGGDFLQKIGTAIGKFIGGVIGGIAKGVTSALPGIAIDLSLFMTNIQPFLSGAKLIDRDAMSGVKSLVEVMALLTGASFLESINSWLTGGSSFTDFASKLVIFGQAIKQYADTISGMDTAAVEASAKAAAGLAELSKNLPRSGGLSELFGGSSSLSDFGDELITFGKSLKGYADSVAGIDVDAVKASAEAGKALTEMANSVPNEGGIKAWFAGDNSLASFSDGIEAFGKAMKSYSESVVGIDVDAINAGTEAGKALTEMTNTIPNTGGVKAWFAGDNSLSAFSDGIEAFGIAIKSYSDNVAGLDAGAVTGAVDAGKALAEMVDVIPNTGGIKAWFAGENSLAAFSDGIIAFGFAMSLYSGAVSGIDARAIMTAANAGKALAEMAAIVPDTGGLKAWFAGDNSLTSFSTGIIDFGAAIKSYSENVTGINARAVGVSAEAGKALAQMADTVPNTGGIKAWFSGNNSLSSFSDGIIAFGGAIKAYSNSVGTVDAEAISASAKAGKALAEMANTVPNSGGIKGWFSGDNSLASFADGIVAFGNAIKSYSQSVIGINADSVAAATSAGKALAEMTKTIPNQGGIKAWFSGDNSLAAFADGIKAFGSAIKSYSESATGINVESIKAATEAGASLAQMTENIPNQGGIKAWFSGSNSLSSFSDGIISFGAAIKSYSENVAEIDPVAVKAATEAGSALAELTDMVPNSGGIKAWFSGESSLAAFSDGIISFGSAMKAYSENVTGINTESIKASAQAGRALAEMAEVVPNSGGIKAWFSEENSLAAFSSGIKTFGKAMKSYSENVAGIDADSVRASASAGKALVGMAETVPNSAGVKGWFSGENGLASFATGIKIFGKAMKSYSENVTGIDAESIRASASAGKALAEMTKAVPNSGGIKAWFSEENSMSSFSNGIKSFGKAMKSYSESVTGINVDAVRASASAGKTLAEMTRSVPKDVDMISFYENIKILGRGLKSFASDISGINLPVINTSLTSVKDVFKSMEEIAKNGIGNFVKEIGNGKTKTADSIEGLISAIENAASAKEESVSKAFGKVADSALKSVSNSTRYTDFYQAGQNLANGFADGIEANTYRAQSAATAMAAAAEKATRARLRINSPSKVFREDGYTVPEGFAQGIDRMSWVVKDSATAMAKEAITGTGNAISRIAALLSTDMDAEPTIRPVLDLSDVSAGANRLSSMLNLNPSVAVLSNLNTIGSGMNRNQNGATNDDIISAIKSLGSKLGPSGDTYSINGITIDDSGNVSEAVKTLVRAARLERRA